MFDSWIFFPINALMFLIFLGIAVGTTIFWIWMLIDCVMNESSERNDKLIWVIIIVFTQLLGALIYYFVRRQRRDRPSVTTDI